MLVAPPAEHNARYVICITHIAWFECGTEGRAISRYRWTSGLGPLNTSHGFDEIKRRDAVALGGSKSR